jgi:murein DD-endopeptidase MepM/ murein hydrolase activator NlpD
MKKAAEAGVLSRWVVLVLAVAGTAGAECREDWICVDEVVQGGGKIELRAQNLRSFPITVTLRVRTRELKVAGPRTVTRTLAPNHSQPILVLSGGKPERGRNYRYSFDWTVGDMDAVHDDRYLYALPYTSGKSYRVLQGYGSRFSHTGLEEYAVDFDMPVGTPVRAARAGVVARIEESNSRGCWDDGCGRFANYIVILHGDGTTGEYYHLMPDGAAVDVGQAVERGRTIGYSGNTGHTTMPHLHFAVYRAIAWGRTQSLPVRFQTADGIIDRPRRGARYPAL